MSMRAVTKISKRYSDGHLCLIGQRCHVGAKRLVHKILTVCGGTYLLFGVKFNQKSI